MRLRKVDDGHYLVPGTDWEVVRQPDGRWAVFEANIQWRIFDTYKQAREWAVRG